MSNVAGLVGNAQAQDVPPRWRRTTLGEIGEYINGRGFKKSEWSDTGLPIIRIQNLTGTGKEQNHYDGEIDERHVVNPGDLLISWSATLGAFLWTGPRAALNQHIFKVRSRVDKKFHYYLMQHILSDLYRQTHGAGMVHITKSKFDSMPVVVPETEDDQKLIVAEIEKQFSRLDEAVANLKRVKANLKRYKAVVLKAAVEGKLTEAWRKQHLDAEPASALLQRILAERRAKWEQAELAKMQAKGKAPKDDTWKKKYPEPTTPDTTGLPELPEGWVWASLGQCFKVAVGATPSRKEQQYWNGNVSWVSSGEVQFCRIRETKEKISEVGLLNSGTQINPPGTVLLGMIGEGKTRGQAAILEIPAANNQNCAAIWVAHAGLPPSYVYHWFAAQYEETRLVGSGNNQQALNKSLVEAMVFPLPPLAEQQAIIEEIERRLSLTDEGESQVNTNLQRAERLRQSILSRAFSGKPHQVEMHTHG